MNNIPKEVVKYENYWLDIFHTGSRVICDPPVTDTDDDWLLFCDEASVKELEKVLAKNGFTIGESQRDRIVIRYYKDGHSERSNDCLKEYPEHESEYFRSWKDKNQLNLILTASPDYFENFKKATYLCQYLNLKEKSDRVAVFEAVLWDKWPERKINKKRPLDEWNILNAGLQWNEAVNNIMPGNINWFQLNPILNGQF